MSHSGIALLDPQSIFEKIGLGSGMRAADLGCGRTGHFVFPSSKVVGDLGIVYAVDVLKDVLKEIKSRTKRDGCDNIHPIWADIELPGRIPIPEKSLDACFIVNVLYNLKDKAEAIAEGYRLLKEDGKLVIVDWKKNLGVIGPEKENLLSKETVLKMGQGIGMNLFDNYDLSDYNYCLIFSKS